MADNWLMEGGAAAAGPTAPQDVVLGTPTVSYDRSKGEVEISIPITWPDPLGTLTGIDAVGDIPDSSPEVGNSSFVLGETDLGESELTHTFRAEYQTFVPYSTDPDARSIVIRKPIPQKLERWRFYGAARSEDKAKKLIPYGQPGATPSVHVDVEPLGTAGSGAEYAAVVQNFVVDDAYYTTNAEGQKTLNIDTSSDAPADENYGGRIIYAITPGTENNTPYPGVQLTGVETGQTTHSTITSFPSTTETWRIYAVSVLKSDPTKVNSYVSGYTPERLKTIAPPATGGPGTEYTTNPTPPPAASLVSVTTLSTDDGTTMLKVVTNYSAPLLSQDPTYGGAIIQAHRPPYGVNDWVFIGEERQPGVAHYVKGPAAVETWRFYVSGRSVNLKYNSIDPSITPRQDISVGSATGKLDITKADVSKYNLNEFWVNPGTNVFEQKVISADKIQTGTLLVGGYIPGTHTPRPGVMLITDNTANVVMWAGQNGSDYGLWAKRGGFGGTSLATAKIKMAADGTTVIDGATFTLNLNGVTVSIQNTYDGTLAEYVGLQVQTNSSVNAATPTAKVTSTKLTFERLVGGLLTAHAQMGVVPPTGTNFAGFLVLREEGNAFGNGRIDLQSAGTASVAVSRVGYDSYEMAAGQGFRCNNLRLLGPRMAAVAAPSGGAVIDVEARAAINAIRAVLGAGLGGHGLTA